MYRNNGVNIAIRLFALREFLYDNADETHAIRFEDIRAFYFAKQFNSEKRTERIIKRYTLTFTPYSWQALRLNTAKEQRDGFYTILRLKPTKCG